MPDDLAPKHEFQALGQRGRTRCIALTVQQAGDNSFQVFTDDDMSAFEAVQATGRIAVFTAKMWINADRTKKKARGSPVGKTMA